MNSILFWGIVPPILLLFYTWRLDRIEREPAGLVIKVFLLGAITTILAVLLESLAALGLSYLDLDESSNLYLLIDNFLAVALIEEFCKRMPVKRSIWKSPEFNYRFDAIVYCLASALGFAATENIVYMISYGTGIALRKPETRKLTKDFGDCLLSYRLLSTASGISPLLQKIRSSIWLHSV